LKLWCVEPREDHRARPGPAAVRHRRGQRDFLSGQQRDPLFGRFIKPMRNGNLLEPAAGIISSQRSGRCNRSCSADKRTSGGRSRYKERRHVLVAPGLYSRNSILRQIDPRDPWEGGPSVTTIDGNNRVLWLPFNRVKTTLPCFAGFTLRHGSNSFKEADPHRTRPRRSSAVSPNNQASEVAEVASTPFHRGPEQRLHPQ